MAGWTTEPVWMLGKREKSLAPSGIRNEDYEHSILNPTVLADYRLRVKKFTFN